MADKYYIIGFNCETAGLFAIWLKIASYILYAKDKGYIPIVDMKHHRNIYFKDNRTYKDNVWEYFFEQPCGIGVNDLKEDSEIIMSDNNFRPDNIYDFERKDIPLSKDDKYKHRHAKDYVEVLKFNDQTKKYLEESYNKIIGAQNDVIGILCRGTDYTKLKPDRHYIPPKPEDVIKKTKSLLKTGEYKRIWLATEDSEVYGLFKKEFPDALIENYQYKYNSNTNDFIGKIKVDRENHSYNLAKEYLLSLYILSKSKAFIGARTCGTAAVYLMSNLFENQDYVYLWDLGAYIKYSPAEHLFSIKNEYGRKEVRHKVFSLAGLKIRL